MPEKFKHYTHSARRDTISAQRAQLSEANRPVEDLIRTYKLYREYSEHEDHLINHRTGWFLTTQTVLLAAFGLFFQNSATPLLTCHAAKSGLTGTHCSLYLPYLLFLVLVCSIALSMCYCAGQSIQGARLAQETLSTSWDKYLKDSSWYNSLDSSPRHKMIPGLLGAGHPDAHKLGKTLDRVTCFFSGLWSVILFGIIFFAWANL